MVHVPLFVSSKFEGKSGAGLFADVVQEVDWSVGQILDALRDCNVDSNTLILFSSDNGPWLSYGDHAGSAGPFREGKGTAWEGGVRVPTLMRWPGVIPSGTSCSQLASTIDILPTITSAIGAELPSSKIDGKDIRALMTDDNALSPHTTFPYYFGNNELQAIRDSRWKLVFPHRYRSLQGRPGGTKGIPATYSNKETGLELYDLRNDPSESRDIAAMHPQVVQRLQFEANHWRAELGDKLTGVKGAAVRAIGE